MQFIFFSKNLIKKIFSTLLLVIISSVFGCFGIIHIWLFTYYLDFVCKCFNLFFFFKEFFVLSSIFQVWPFLQVANLFLLDGLHGFFNRTRKVAVWEHLTSNMLYCKFTHNLYFKTCSGQNLISKLVTESNPDPASCILRERVTFLPSFILTPIQA